MWKLINETIGQLKKHNEIKIEVNGYKLSKVECAEAFSNHFSVANVDNVQMDRGYI